MAVQENEIVKGYPVRYVSLCGACGALVAPEFEGRHAAVHDGAIVTTTRTWSEVATS